METTLLTSGDTSEACVPSGTQPRCCRPGFLSPRLLDRWLLPIWIVATCRDSAVVTVILAPTGFRHREIREYVAQLRGPTARPLCYGGG